MIAYTFAMTRRTDEPQSAMMSSYSPIFGALGTPVSHQISRFDTNEIQQPLYLFSLILLQILVA